MFSGLKKFFRYLKRIVQPMTDMIPITALGLVLSAAAFSAWLLWVDGQLDFVIRSVVFTTIIVLGVCIVFTLIGTILVFRSVRGAEKSIVGQWETGELKRTGFTLPRLRYWPLIQVNVTWAHPVTASLEMRRDKDRFVEFVRCEERGRFAHILRRVTIQDIFGFSAMTIKHRQPVSIRVTPSLSVVSLAPDLRSSDGDGLGNPLGEPVGDFVDMRRYGPGDPLRFILWKAYARSRRLLVRTPERALAPMPSAAAYFVCGPGDEDTASVARTVIESGLLGEDLVFGADGVPDLVRTPQGAIDAIIDSVHHRDRAGMDFAAFVHRLDPRKLSQCVLFLPSLPGPWLTHIQAEILKLPRLPMLMIAVDGPVSVERSRREQWLFSTPKAAQRMQLVPELYERVKGLGHSVQIIHRGEGRILTIPEIEALRAV